jgi:aerobic C4-dicarboxylate transport protein
MRKSLFSHLYTWVLLAIVFGGLLGYYFPEIGSHQTVSDGFIKLIRTVVTHHFTTVVIGIAGMQSFKRVGRVGLKAIIYFEVATTLALVIGWVVVKWIQPGAGVDADPAKLDTKVIQHYVTQSQGHGLVDFFLNVIPSTFFGAFASGDIVQVLFFSVLRLRCRRWANAAGRSC